MVSQLTVGECEKSLEYGRIEGADADSLATRCMRRQGQITRRTSRLPFFAGLVVGLVISAAMAALTTMLMMRTLEARLQKQEEAMQQMQMLLIDKRNSPESTPFLYQMHSYDSSADTDIGDIHEGSAAVLNEREKRQASSQRGNAQRPLTHLSGLDQQSLRSFGDSGNEFFLWKRPHEQHFVSMFVYELFMDYVRGINITRAGIYMIYNQIALNGQIQNGDKPECGHETVVLRGNETKVLMKSLTTQDQRGMAYSTAAAFSGPVYPLDSEFQMGLFLLLPRDVLRVRRLSSCHHVRYMADPHYTYFGLKMEYPV